MMMAAFSRPPVTAVVVSLAMATGFSRAEVPQAELAAIRREVLTMLAEEARARSFDERRQAVTAIVALHERLVEDGRFEASPALQALQRRVDGRLARVGRALAGEAARSDSAPARSEAAADDRSAPGGRQAESQKLIDLIQATVRPETWDVNGGRGSIAYFANGHGLVVLATAHVHDDLGALLRQLR